MADVLIDAGPLIALFDRRDSQHQRCLTWIKINPDQLLTTTGVLTEATHVLNDRISIQAAIDCLTWVDAAINIQDTSSDVAAAIKIMQQYHDLPSDYVDAELVALANRLDLFRVATIDQDFTIYRGAGRQTFECVIP